MSVQDDLLTPSVLIHRAGVAVENVITPAVSLDSEPLRIEAFQTPERLPYKKAVHAAGYRPVKFPFRWGPAWSTTWFRVSGRVPRRWSGGCVALHVVSNGEAQVWIDAEPYQGISPYHSRIPLMERCRGGEAVDLYLEAAANQLLGSLQGVPPDHGDEPALITKVELIRMDAAALRFAVDLAFAAELLAVSQDLLDGSRNWGGSTAPALMSPDARRLARALDDALNGLREHDLCGTLPAAHQRLRAALRAPKSAAATECRAVGHSHIDVAWLWPLAETRRKCARTFSSMLRHMERDPDFVYVQSQAQVYAFVEQDYPALARQIERRVREGRWEAAGGMWVEADCNLASGESLVRQLLHGIRFFRDRYGTRGDHRYLWLPDLFGYSAALPQIMLHCGLDTFFTQKISWNETNRFPHTTFWWRGIDGSRVLSHFFPTDNYNGQVTPRELLRGDYNNQQSDLIPFWMNPVGYGDGGGGPNIEILNRVRTAARAPLLPRVRYQLPGAFSGDLHRAAGKRALPSWQGELYLELHRGTLTTHALVKQRNRLAELGLRETELWNFLAWGGSSRYPAAALDRLWKNVLLHQFHDILPGSSISAVYTDTHRDYDDILQELTERRENAFAVLAARFSPPPAMKRPYAVFNAAENMRDGVVSLPDGSRSRAAGAELVYVSGVPGMGASLFEGKAAQTLPDGVAPVTATSRTLDNGIVRVRLDAAGRVCSLVRKANGREMAVAGNPMNQLVLYADRPNRWDAWDINRHYLKMGDAVTAPARMRRLDRGPLRATIETRRSLGTASEIVQRIQLDAGSPRVDFVTWVKWREKHCLLRVLHPVEVVSDTAIFEIQFGHVRRATHVNTSWENARFEAPAHTWMDLSERGSGVALLNNAKYGHSCIENVMGLSLLRAPRMPDESADVGDHVFTYSLMPHDGDPLADGVVEQARDLNQPLRVFPVARAANRSGKPAPDDERFVLRSCALPAGISAACFKKAEDSDELVVRLVEVAGRRRTVDIPWFLPVKSVSAIDALEQPTRLFRVRYDARRRVASVPFTPFAIRTLKLTL